MRSPYRQIAVVSVLCAALFGVSPVHADPATTQVTCGDGSTQTATRSGTTFTDADYQRACSAHGGYTSPTQVPGTSKCTDGGGQGDCAKTTAFSFGTCGTTNVGIKCLAVEVLRFLSIGVGLAVVGGVAAGGIVYATAQGSPGKTQSGIKIITNSILALILYLLMFAILQFLIPGGVLS